MYPGHAIGTGRPFVENEGIGTFPQFHAGLKSLILFPGCQHFFFKCRQVQLAIFLVSGLHKLIQKVGKITDWRAAFKIFDEWNLKGWGPQ
jgi:hypothetical protein